MDNQGTLGVLQERQRATAGRQTDDKATVAGLRSGSVAHIEGFVRSNIAWMRAAARRILGDEALADDCVQEAFLKALGKIDSFEGRSSLKTWLHRITVNEALMKLRVLKRLGEQSIDQLMPEFDQSGCRIEAPWASLATSEEIVERESTRALVLSKIRELPENYRIVLLLRDIEEMETAEVAKLLDLSPSNVKVRLHRARAALKKLLEPLLRGELG